MTVSRCLRDSSQVSKLCAIRSAFAVRRASGYILIAHQTFFPTQKAMHLVFWIPSLTNQVFAEVIVALNKSQRPQVIPNHDCPPGYSAELEEQSIASPLSYNVDAIILSENVHTDRAACVMKDVADCFYPCDWNYGFSVAKERTSGWLLITSKRLERWPKPCSTGGEPMCLLSGSYGWAYSLKNGRLWTCDARSRQNASNAANGRCFLVYSWCQNDWWVTWETPWSEWHFSVLTMI